MSKVYLILFWAAVVASSQAWGSEGKIAFVDVERLFEKYQKTQDLNVKLEQERNEKIAQRKEVVEEINKLKDEADLLRDEAKSNKEKLVDEKVKDLYQFEETVKREAMKKQIKLQDEIIDDIKEALAEIGRSEGYDIIFAFTEDDISYHAGKLDLTDNTIKFLNKKYRKDKE
jgi:Skp family chaperone for outer membrane proteins